MRRKLGEILLAHRVVSTDDIDAALADQGAGDPARLGDQLVAMGRITPTQLGQALSEQYGVPFTGLPNIPESVLGLVDHGYQKKFRLVPFREDGHRVLVAVADPANLDAVDRLATGLGREVVAFVAPGDEIDAVHAAAEGDVMLLQDGPPPAVELPDDVAPDISPLDLSGEHGIDDFFGDVAADPPPSAPGAPAAGGAGLGDLFDGLSLENEIPAMPAFTERELPVVVPPMAPAGAANARTITAEEELSSLVDELDAAEAPAAPRPAAAAKRAAAETDAEEDAFYSSLESQEGAPAPSSVESELFGDLGGEAPMTDPGIALDAAGDAAAAAVDDAWQVSDATGPEASYELTDSMVGVTADPEALPEPSYELSDSLVGVSSDSLPAVEISDSLPAVELTDSLPGISPADFGDDDGSVGSAPSGWEASEAMAGSPGDSLEAEIPQVSPPPPPPAIAAIKPGRGAEMLPVAPASEAAPHPTEDALPAWLAGDGAAADVGGWTGALDGVEPERLARALARALVKRGNLSEQDLLDALDEG